ncbi:MAG: hypothetical protein KDK70_30900 [Myxococcales bacterium]|nr:hypothetical protein [Myxococcales bacterium]
MIPEILIVGDASGRAGLRERIQRLGYRATVGTAADLERRVDEREIPSAIVVCTEDEDPRELMAKLRGTRLGSGVPVTLYGPLGGRIGDLVDVLDLGADHFLEEPADDAQLAAAVVELAGPGESLPPQQDGPPAETGSGSGSGSGSGVGIFVGRRVRGVLRRAHVHHARGFRAAEAAVALAAAPPRVRVRVHGKVRGCVLEAVLVAGDHHVAAAVAADRVSARAADELIGAARAAEHVDAVLPAQLVREFDAITLALVVGGAAIHGALAWWVFHRGLRHYASGSRFGVRG